MAVHLNALSEILVPALSIGVLASTTQSKIAELSTKVNKLERNQDLLFWKETIEDRIFNGFPYPDLPEVAKLICLVSEFYEMTRGAWDGYRDLTFLRSVLRELGLGRDSVIPLAQLIGAWGEGSELQEKLLIANGLGGRSLESPIHAPIIAGLHKAQSLAGQECYLVETISGELADAGIEADDSKVRLNLATKYLAQLAMMRPNVGLPAFDLAVELLSGMEVLASDTVKEVEEKNLFAELESKVKAKDEKIEILLTDIKKLTSEKAKSEAKVKDNLPLLLESSRKLLVKPFRDGFYGPGMPKVKLVAVDSEKIMKGDVVANFTTRSDDEPLLSPSSGIFHSMGFEKIKRLKRGNKTWNTCFAVKALDTSPIVSGYAILIGFICSQEDDFEIAKNWALKEFDRLPEMSKVEAKKLGVEIG